MVAVSMSLIGANGDVISLDEDSDFILTVGALGFGMPATSVRIDESAADGGVWRNTKRGVRQIDLPITIVGSSRSDVEDKLRRLSRLIQDKAGETKIRAAYQNGDKWEIGVHYTGGAESQYGGSGNENWMQWVLSFQAPDPYWTSLKSESYSLGTEGAGRSLIPNLAEMRVSSSQAIGLLEVENTGDVESYPRWQIRGPIDSMVATSATGEIWSYAVPILTGSTIYVDTFNATVVDQTGANKYGNLGAAPKLFTIPPGRSTVNVSAIGATSATLISLFYQPRKEVLH